MKSRLSLALCLAFVGMTLPVSAQENRAVLSLHDAIKTALEKSPSFGAAIDRADATKEATSKAGALPNPELSVEAENIGGSGPYEGFDGAEITYGVSQLVEMPGKRSGRQGVAKGEERKTFYMRDGARLDLIRDVVIAYAEAVAAQEQLKVLQEEQTLAFDVHKTVSAKVDAGKEPPIQKNKAAIALASSEIALERAQRNAESSKKILGNLLGGQAVDFSIAPETLPAMKQPLGLATYTEMISKTPDNLIYDAAIETAQSSLSLEKANVVPDPTINVGVRDFRDDNEQALVAGVSFPFPVFDMNRAGVRRAGHEYNAAMLDKVNARLESENDLVKSYEIFSNAYREHQVLKDTVLTGAQEAFSVAREGYMAGKFGYLEVLDAQRTLFEARKQSIQTMLDYYREMAVIDRLTAAHSVVKKEENQ
jgi:cobalt-zinc-cadmium efflux system outer membrane protein